MTTDLNIKNVENEKSKVPLHGLLGLLLVIVFWILNWTLPGTHTHWGFFPLWLGYCLAMDGLVFWRTGTSLLTRSWRKYVGLFLVSAPVWWIFELLNLRTQNWIYIGADVFTPLEYRFWTTLCVFRKSSDVRVFLPLQLPPCSCGSCHPGDSAESKQCKFSTACF